MSESRIKQSDLARWRKCLPALMALKREFDKTDMERAASHYKRELKKLTEGVTGFLALLDREMQQPSTEARGRRIAKLCNDLDMLNDRIRYSALGIDFRSDGKPARQAALNANPVEPPLANKL